MAMRVQSKIERHFFVSYVVSIEGGRIIFGNFSTTVDTNDFSIPFLRNKSLIESVGELEFVKANAKDSKIQSITVIGIHEFKYGEPEQKLFYL
jgi:hypothetical protein